MLLFLYLFVFDYSGALPVAVPSAHDEAVAAMEYLRDLNVDPSLSRKDLESALLKIPHRNRELEDLRHRLFRSAQESGLAHVRDILIKRRHSAETSCGEVC